MIVVMQGSDSVPANGKINNVLSGAKYERPPFDADGALYGCGSALGLFAELNVNGMAVSDKLAVNSQNRFPVVPDDSVIDGWEAPAGGLIQLGVSNTTTAALSFFWKIELEEANMGYE